MQKTNKRPSETSCRQSWTFQFDICRRRWRITLLLGFYQPYRQCQKVFGLFWKQRRYYSTSRLWRSHKHLLSSIWNNQIPILRVDCPRWPGNNSGGILLRQVCSKFQFDHQQRHQISHFWYNCRDLQISYFSDWIQSSWSLWTFWRDFG